jgi:hypothetical protein
MGQRTIPILTVGAVVLAAVTARFLDIPFRKDGTTILLVLAFLLPTLLLSRLIASMGRNKRLRNWCLSEGTIESCEEDSLYKGIQSYRCGYVFRPDETREGGTFLISESATDSKERLDEIRKELIGCSIRVRYDPNDYTRSIVEDEQVLNWGVEND